MIKEKVLKVLRSLPPETNIESESIQQHIADQIYDELLGTSKERICQLYFDYLLKTCKYHGLDPTQVIRSRAQPGMDIKHCIRYILYQKGYSAKKISEIEGSDHGSVLNGIYKVQSAFNDHGNQIIKDTITILQ